MYVKFLKHLACFLCFVGILSLISIGMYYIVSIDLEFPITENYENFIFAGTTGIMASQFSKCRYGSIEPDGANFKVDFSVYCAEGKVNYLGIVFSN